MGNQRPAEQRGKERIRPFCLWPACTWERGFLPSAATVNDRSDGERIIGSLKSRRRVRRKIIFLFPLQLSGILEKWLHKLVSALHTRERYANVVVVDWLPLAHQLYVDAVNNTRVVGQRVARMLDWLQVRKDKREPSLLGFPLPLFHFLR